jgi:hypothetical protein
MSNPWSQAYEDLRKPYLEGKMAKKDYDGDGKIESGKDEYMGSIDKAIKKRMGKKVAKEHHQKDADGKVIEHEDTTPSSVEEGQINELSKKTLSDYTRKSATSLAKHSMEFGSKPNKKDQKKLEKRHSGIMKAASKMANEENVDEMITLTKGDYASRNVVGSAYNTAAKKKFDSKIYKAGGGLGSNFLPLANSQEPEGDMVEAKEEVEIGNELNELNKQERMETVKKGSVGVGKRFSKKEHGKGQSFTSGGNVGRRNMRRFEKSHGGDGSRKLNKFGSDYQDDYRSKDGLRATQSDHAQKQRRAEHEKRRGVKTKGVKKESFSDWRSEFVWEDGDSIKKT